MCIPFCEGLNKKRLAMAFVAAFAFNFVFDWVFHGMILSEAYQQTASHWRPQAEMQGMMCWMTLGQALTALFFTVLFAKGYESKGIMEGVRFGVLAGGLMVAPHLVDYAVSPLPCSLIAAWMVGGMIQAVLGGVVLSLVYKK